MKREMTSFERRIRNSIRKQKNEEKKKEDEEIYNKILSDMKNKYETEKQQQIDELTKKLEKAKR